MPKVLIADSLSAAAVEVFRQRGVEVDVRTGLKPAELAAVIGGYEGLAVRSATKVTADILKESANLKVIGRAGIGVDNIDVPAATARGIVVMNTPFGNSITTAEHSITLMMALARQIPEADRSTRAGKWEKNRFMGVEITGKTLGIIGCGNIGSIVANRAQGLHMRVVAYDPFLSAERARDLGVEKVDLDDLFARSDFITLHVPLVEGTRHVIDAKAIAKMKKGVRIINCARGGLVVEADVKAAIESGTVAGAAFDVFEVEPAKENVLFGLENVVLTPHLGASTGEAQENVAVQVAEQMADFLLTGAVVNAVNMPSVSAEDAPKLGPYMRLVEQLGRFAGQLAAAPMRDVTIDYEGHVAELNTRPLTALTLCGLFSPSMETVNMVNAPVIARERKLEVAEIKREQSADYQSLVRVKLATETGTHVVAGTLFGGSRPRVVEVEGIAVEAELGATMLFVRNADKPGFIGKLGRTLGDAGVNIATFHLGRADAGGDAIALVRVDQNLTPEILAKVAALPHVNEAKVLTF